MNTTALYDKLHLLFLDNENINEKELKEELYTSESEGFIPEDRAVFIEFLAYLYSKKYNINELISIPIINYDNNEILTFGEFHRRLLSYQGKDHEFNEEDKAKYGVNNYYEYALKTIGTTLLKGKNCFKVNSFDIHNEEEPMDLFKLYVPVNNYSLYYFATLLIARCEAKGINYKFKVNSDPKKQLGNNIEITINIKNSYTMRDTIEEILAENPAITVDKNKMPLVALNITENIGAVPIVFNGDYEDVICEEIINTKNNGGTFGTFTDVLDRRFQHYFKDIKTAYKIQDDNEKKTTIL